MWENLKQAADQQASQSAGPQLWKNGQVSPTPGPETPKAAQGGAAAGAGDSEWGGWEAARRAVAWCHPVPS